MRIDYDLLRGSLDPRNVIASIRFDIAFRQSHPDFFEPEGILIFCGSQGSGKTLSAVQYIKKVCAKYPMAILVTNVDIDGLPPTTQVIEYNGLDCLKNIENGHRGVIYFVDEIHLELNSLESKNIDMDTIVELSQQRKQRKHIVGTSQVYMRMAKPLREQVKDIVLCSNYFKYVQINKLIDGYGSHEDNGKLIAKVVKRFLWLHQPKLYASYDTYAKMRRYKLEWQGHKRIEGGNS